jgi:predicted chitinase
MKLSVLFSWVVGQALLLGCSQGVEGARDMSPGANTGGNTAQGGSSSTSGSSSTAGTNTLQAGSTSGGAPHAAGTSTGGMPPMPMPCGPAWMAGATYAQGDIVAYEGSYFVAEHENPGYDPLISTYFWEPYHCPTGGGGGNGGTGSLGGSGPLGDSAFDDIVSEETFNRMFPDRNQFYTYQGLVEATRHYPAFAGSGSDEQRKREAAAFLANVARETGELVYIEQIEKDVYCQPSDGCPCQQGKQYYGRGPIQISWNYNYCAAGTALGIDLRAQPELVAQDATIAWETGLWFWMTQTGAGNFTPHDGIVDGHGFGETIRSINGGQECGGKWPEAVQARSSFYQNFCNILGVSPGDNVQC